MFHLHVGFRPAVSVIYYSNNYKVPFCSDQRRRYGERAARSCGGAADGTRAVRAPRAATDHHTRTRYVGLSPSLSLSHE